RVITLLEQSRAAEPSGGVSAREARKNLSADEAATTYERGRVERAGFAELDSQGIDPHTAGLTKAEVGNMLDPRTRAQLDDERMILLRACEERRGVFHDRRFCAFPDNHQITREGRDSRMERRHQRDGPLDLRARRDADDGAVLHQRGVEIDGGISGRWRQRRDDLRVVLDEGFTQALNADAFGCGHKRTWFGQEFAAPNNDAKPFVLIELKGCRFPRRWSDFTQCLAQIRVVPALRAAARQARRRESFPGERARIDGAARLSFA